MSGEVELNFSSPMTEADKYILPSESPHREDPFEWLAIQNRELKDKIKRLEIGIYHWTLSASESNERLNRVCQSRGKQAYVDTFYDSTIKRLIQSLTEENVALKKELRNTNGLDGGRNISELQNTMRTLTEKFEMTTVENKLLKSEISKLKTVNHPEDVQRKNFDELEREYLKTTRENRFLENNVNKDKFEIMRYLKSVLQKERKEFLKIFTEHYLENGEEFVNQLKLLDPLVPDFLNEPVRRDASTNTDLCLPNPDQHTISVMEYLELGGDKEKEKYSEERLTTQIKQDIMINERDGLNLSLECRNKRLEEDLRTKVKELVEADEWKIAYDQLYTEFETVQTKNALLERKYLEGRRATEVVTGTRIISPLRHGHSSSPELRGYTRQIPRDKVMERYQTANWSGFNAPSILVRDSPIKPSADHSPQKHQESSIAHNKGVVCSKEATNQSTEDGKSIEQKALMKCKICKRDFMPEKYDLHVRYCGKSGSHMC